MVNQVMEFISRFDPEVGNGNPQYGSAKDRRD